MAISADFSVEGSSTVQAHSVAYGATADFALLSLTGVETIEWSIIGTSKSTQSAPTITPAGSPSGATATVVMPSDPGDGLGRAFLMKALVRGPGGTPTAEAYRVFGAANAGGVIPLCNGEELYRHATHGWTDVFNQALNASFGGAGGSSGQLQYNNAGAIDGASGISVVGSETAVAFGTTPAAADAIRLTNNMGIRARNVANDADLRLIRGDSGDNVIVGGTTTGNDVYLDVASGKNINLRFAGGAVDYVFTSTEANFTGNALQFGTNPSATGMVRGPNNFTGGVLSARNAGNTADVRLVHLSSSDKVFFGDGADAVDMQFEIFSGTYAFAVAGGIEYTFSATALDLNGNTLQEVGDFDHDGTNLGFYGTAPIAKQTGVAVSAAGVHAALVNLGLIAA